MRRAEWLTTEKLKRRGNMKMTISHAGVVSLLKTMIRPSEKILLDDGEFCIEIESDINGLLLRICDLALLEEDDAECSGGYHQRQDGTWIINFCSENNSDSDTLENVSGEFDDRDSAVAALWMIRHKTVSYRVKRK